MNDEVRTAAGRAMRLAAFAYFVFTLLWTVLNLADVIDRASSGTLSYFAVGDRWLVTDYVHFYEAGKIALSADRLQAYDPAVQLAWLNRIIAPVQTDSESFVQYMPFVFPLMTPFASIPLHWSQVLFAFSTLAFGAVCLLALTRRGRQWNLRSAAIFIVAVASSLPSVQTIVTGQISWFLTAVTAIYCLVFVKRREYIAGACLALATVKPQYAIWLAIPAVAGRRYRLLAALVVTELALICLAAAAVGWQNVINYPSILFHAESATPVAAEAMVSVRGVLSQLLPASQTTVIGINACLWIAGLAAAVVMWSRPKEADHQAYLLSFTIIAAVVLSPHGHLYDTLLLAIPAALTLPSISIAALKDTPDPTLRLWHLIWWLYPLVGWLLFLPTTFVPQARPALFLAVHSLIFVLAFRLAARR